MDLYNEERLLWLSEQDIYREYGNDVKNIIINELKKNGLSAKISYRVKEIDSLIKKIARKNSSYEAIHDKVGIRVIACFKDQLNEIDTVLCRVFKSDLRKREDMKEKLGDAIFGYQSIHYDICKILNNNECFCEIQLRTICQDNWSEISHELSYKSEINIPLDISREINALSAIFEIADNQFQLINNMIYDLPDTNPIRILNHLEKYFYTYIGSVYDQQLSWYFLKDISSEYPNSNPISQVQNCV